MKKIARYGWIPDLPDRRDFKYSAIKPALDHFPRSVDLRKVMGSSIQDQGLVGSCTAHAAVAALERERRIDLLPFHALSRLFIYYNARLINQTPQYDSGATLRETALALSRWGATWEGNWPYDVHMVTSPPDERSYSEGLKWRIKSYHRLDTLDDMLSCLASRHPFIFGFTVYESFESFDVWEGGIVPMPKPGESVMGGHAVCAVGYDLDQGTILCRNSWGKSYGMAGHFTMPFAYVEDRNLSDDFWTMRF